MQPFFHPGACNKGPGGCVLPGAVNDEVTGPSIQGAEPADLFGTHRRRVWGVAYRLTGSAEDAEDIVQETFARLLERPPAQGGPALGAWLLRVATHLGIDALRRRRRRRYPGPWLPAAVEASDADWLDSYASPDPDPEARYGLLESVAFAYLLALEALGPRQRAALLLRDVLGYSASETAAILGTSEGNVRVLHLRARRAMQGYEGKRCRPTAELRARHREALERFLGCLLAQDEGALESLLTESVRTVTDAGGEYTALATPLEGRSRVARLYVRAALHRLAGSPAFETRLVNGLPAALVQLAHPVRRQAPRAVIFLDLRQDGAIQAIHALLAPRKLAAVRFPPLPPVRPV
jgi:RNA polymerase sigma factor (sigma-70 family)